MEIRLQQQGGKKRYGYMVGIGVGALFHPFHHAKVLIQLGYEPLKPVKSKLLFSNKEMYYYPNGFKYVKYLYDEYGFLGLYTGLVPALCSRVLGSVTASQVFEIISAKYLPPSSAAEQQGETDDSAFRRFLQQFGCEAFAHCTGLIVAQPFKVIMTRKMAQIIGGETDYGNMASSVKIILDEEGVAGLFSGLLPTITGELLLLISTNTAVFALDRIWMKYFNEEPEEVDENELMNVQNLHPVSTAKKLLRFIVPYITGSFFYPFQVVSTVMCVNGSSLAAGHRPHIPVFLSWQDAYSYLKAEKQLNRGAKLFYRRVIPAHKQY